MGRAKLRMKLIEKESSRLLTFKKRSESLAKKLHELTVLCDVGGCMIIRSPYHTSVWPPHKPNEVRRLIDMYKSKSKEIGGVKTSGPSDFFKNRLREVEDEVAELRKKNSEAKYPTWSQCLDRMDKTQLRGLGAALLAKAQFVRSRIEFLKMREKQELETILMMSDSSCGQFYHDNVNSAVHMPFMQPNFASLDWPVIGQQYQYYAAPPPPPTAVQMPQLNMFWPGNSTAPLNSLENVNYWGDDDDTDVERYFVPFNGHI